MSAAESGPRPVAAASWGARRGDAFAGTTVLIRFNLRRDRIRLPVWIGSLLLVTLGSVSSLTTQYATAEERASVAETLRGPAGLAMTGPERYVAGEYTYGAMTSHQLIGFTAIAIGIMSVLTVVRHTRTEEEAGRAELVRAGVVGRHAHLTAALTVAATAGVALGLVLAAGLTALGVDSVSPRGSLLYGATSALIGITFAAIAAVAAQITPFARGASGLGLAAVALAYALRAVGDVGTEALSWLSPIGWAQRAYPYVDDRWWPLLPHIALTAACVAAAFALGARRDVGSGLRPPRPGRPTASEALASPLGLAVRLHRGVFTGFAAGAALFGLMYGSILGDAEQLIENNDELRRSIGRLGGDVVESFASVIMGLLAVLAASYVVVATLRARGEETAGRAEPLLATGLSRTRWLAGHLTVALVGGTLVMALAGVGFGVAGAASSGDGDLLWRLPLASLVYVPALWATAGAALALYGWFPAASGAAWAIPGYAFFVTVLGEVMDVPDVLRDVSPIGHVPQLPAADMSWTAPVVLALLGAALTAAGLAGLRRRDLDLK
ncbi:ABC transporter permease [Streptomyces marincola]|uniref:ABC transporter permease n=1 Tax=Streptomyces marincola TaxID=2878388 RepID=A0A1W7CZ46_9ACTN|nr:ABC transporter permease [Streptomyces marincola]ARQ69580.1 ABC transporter permease [Streptomyces marincola]